jgi:hypothetical protein
MKLSYSGAGPLALRLPLLPPGMGVQRFLSNATASSEEWALPPA